MGGRILQRGEPHARHVLAGLPRIVLGAAETHHGAALGADQVLRRDADRPAQPRGLRHHLVERVHVLGPADLGDRLHVGPVLEQLHAEGDRAQLEQALEPGGEIGHGLLHERASGADDACCGQHSEAADVPAIAVSNAGSDSDGPGLGSRQQPGRQPEETPMTTPIPKTHRRVVLVRRPAGRARRVRFPRRGGGGARARPAPGAGAQHLPLARPLHARAHARCRLLRARRSASAR